MSCTRVKTEPYIPLCTLISTSMINDHSADSVSSFTDLPATVLLDVAGHLDAASLGHMACCCKELQHVASQVLSSVRALRLVPRGRGGFRAHTPASAASKPLTKAPLPSFFSAQHAATMGFSRAMPRQLALITPLLRSLDLSSCFQLVDDGVLAALPNLPHLHHLCLDHCTSITPMGLQALGSAVPGLVQLSMRNCGQGVGDGAPLAALTLLSGLNVAWCTGITGEALLGVAPHLVELDVTGCDLVDDSLCPAMVCVEVLSLAFTRVTNTGLSTLAYRAPRLEKLTLGVLNNNIYTSGLYTDSGLQAFTAMRPAVAVKCTAA